LIDRYEVFKERRSPPVGEDPFSIEWTREAIEEVVDKGVGHVSQVSICVGYVQVRGLRV